MFSFLKPASNECWAMSPTKTHVLVYTSKPTPSLLFFCSYVLKPQAMNSCSYVLLS